MLALSLPTQFFAVQVYIPSFWTFKIFSMLWSHTFSWALHGVQVIVGGGYPLTLHSSDTLFSLPTEYLFWRVIFGGTEMKNSFQALLDTFLSTERLATCTCTVDNIWKIFAMLNQWRQRCSTWKVADYWNVNQEDLGTSFRTKKVSNGRTSIRGC